MDAVRDLERHGDLIRIGRPVDPNLELAEIQRRVYAASGPALFFEQVEGSPFPAASNLFGTTPRCRHLFRHSLERSKRAIELRADPARALRQFWRHLGAPWTGLTSLPKRSFRAPVLANKTTISALPQLRCWPLDGGPFITLPQVYSEDPDNPGPLRSNLGMYRVQLAGNDYEPDREVGLHYQIHRGIGVHHSQAIARGEKLKVSVFVGGPPAHTFAAVMPLPEGLSELVFAGMLAGRRFRHASVNGHRISADADFCIVGTIDPEATKPEGPFGDHLGYYSLAHDFPVMTVEAVYHREGAVWPFTVVGRPPQEDTSFGAMIHELTGPMVPVSIPGLHAMHAVDSAGVHPLLFAIGSERYTPYRSGRPQELLTIANAILGFNQASLAKYLFICNEGDAPNLDIRDEAAFLRHMLERVDWTRDLHFHTKTTMDTLDYSSPGLNEGSKVVIAATGTARRSLATEVPTALSLPEGFTDPTVAAPGVLVVAGPPWTADSSDTNGLALLLEYPPMTSLRDSFPLLVVVDDAAFASRSLHNLLWTTFTRSNPASDLHGVESFIEHKHWGCRGPALIDARTKQHHAPPLVEDPEITKRVDALGVRGQPLHGII